MTRSGSSGTAARVKALDLFAGTGWGVACQRLGIKEAGVEIMPEAVETRTANGMDTIYRDVWDGLTFTAEQHRQAYGSYGLLIASPPCQTFSMAGSGKGRAALNEVLEAIELHAYKDPHALRAFGEKHDMRTALVLTPLAYVWRDRPRIVAMEQVPTVLPVWEACAEVMREWGYEVKVEVLNAEQYGVPQTRKRAILVARRGGPVALPTPTHSRYYPRTPEKIDPGVQPWVSMAEALGWPAGADRTLRSNYGTGGDPAARGQRPSDHPAPTLTSKADRNKWDGVDPLTEDQASRLQTFPGWGFTNRPAITVAANVWRGLAAGSGGTATVQKGIDDGTFIPSPHGDGSSEYSQQTRITLDEAAVLQTYPPFQTGKPFVWCGTKGKKFLQIGNAVPPLLAEHILAALLGITPGR